MKETAEEIQRHIMQLEAFLRETPYLPADVREDVRAEISEYRILLYRMREGLIAS